MKKQFSLSALTVLSLLFTSCAIQRNPKTSSSKEISTLTETVEIQEDEIFEKTPKTGEYTHLMAEADADDISIKQSVGASDIDEVDDKESGIPYAHNFLAQKNTKRMKFWVDYFTVQQRERFQRFLNNGEEYRHHIEAVFEAHGLPKELYFVGLIESGYYLGARSHAAAVGPWQFIPGTAKRYHLKINSEMDERQDLFKATTAAAMYFKDLHNIFSSWELALSAYNAGEYGMIRRILKHGTRDFYKMSKNKQLPSETINYVPKVLAAMHVANNAEKYGFVLPKKKHRLFDLTELKAIKKNVPLSSIANRLDVNLALLKKLNPELRRASTPRHYAGTYFLRVPKSKYSYRMDDVATTEMAFVSRPESRSSLNRRIAASANKRFHRVSRGETLYSIARKYETSPKELVRVNSFKNTNTKVKVGQKIALSETLIQKVSVKFASPKVRMTKSPVIYRVSKGDNIKDLARLFNVTVGEMKSVNKLKRGQVVVGQKIVLPDTRKGIYTVRHGDHLYKVAKDLNRPVEALVKLNSLKRKTIYPGQKIIVNMD